jgi:hypothetical protein
MAAGDLTLFDEFTIDEGNGVHNLGSDTIKVMFISNAVVPTAGTATPRKADFTEVSGGNFPVGGTTMTVSWTEAAGTATLDFTSNISLASNASNPNNVYYALIYNDTATNDEAIGFVEIDATGHDATGGATGITWGANIFTKAIV